MAKNESSKCPARSSCKKICKATFGTFHRVSDSPKQNNVPNPSLATSDNPTAKARVSYTLPIAVHQPASGQEIPVESVPPHELTPVKKFVRFFSKNTEKNGDGVGKELAGQKTFSEEKYNNYIEGMKKKMSAPSDVGHGKTVSKHDSFNDRVSSYIRRAKLKMRTASNMGAGGKTVSFK